MSDADVVYTDVKFSRERRNKAEVTSSPLETTYSEVHIPKVQPPPSSAAAAGSQTAASAASESRGQRRSGVFLLILGLLLVAALAALAVCFYKITESGRNLEKLQRNYEVALKNLTVLTERRCERNHTVILPQHCPRPKPEGEPCRCDAGWEHHAGRCYLFSDTKLNWTQSRSRCQQVEADLVIINSTDEQAFLDKRLGAKMEDAEDKFWIGLSDSEMEGQWLWVNGAPLENSFWLGNEPDNWTGDDPQGEDCARMGEKQGGANLKSWVDKSCGVLQKSVCERRANGRYELTCV